MASAEDIAGSLPAATVAGMRQAARWTIRVLLVALVAVAGLLLGLRLAGPTERDTALGVVSLRVSPSLDGKVDAFIPLANWGIRADAFRAPLVIHVEPRTIDRQAVIRAAGGEREVLAAAQRDAQDAAGDALLRALAWALAGALLAALLAAAFLHWARRMAWRRAALAGGTVVLAALLLGGGSLLRVQHSFDADAFEAPGFYARGAELGQLLKVAGRKKKTTSGAYRSQVDRTLSSYAELLSAGGGRGLAPAGQRAILISDLHANTLVLDTVERLATGSPVFFAGDFAQSGSRAEAGLLVDRITALGQVVAVSGNHDSSVFMDALEDAGAVVLETGDAPRTIAGVTVAGYSDPLMLTTGDPNDPDRIFSFSELPDFEERWAQAKEDVVAWFRTLSPRPQVVLIHHNGLAQALAAALQEESGPPLTILSGHDHLQHVDLYGNTLVLDAGTVGAGGLLGAGKDAIGVAQFELAAGQAWPRLVDLVELEPLSGAAEAERVLPASAAVCDHRAVECHEPDEKLPDKPKEPPEEEPEG
jgi:predicted phosphodiesterase